MPGQGSTKMVSPTTVHSMAQQHHPGPYTASDYRVELPSHVVLNGKDHKVALASLTYLTYGMWPMPNSTRPASLSCQATPTHPPTHFRQWGGERMWWQWWQEALVPSLPGHHLHQGLMDTVPGHYDSIRAILDELNCQAHGHIQSDIRIVAFRQWLVQCFRPGLQHCMTQVVLIWLLSLSLGWPDEETVLIRWGNTHFRAPSSPRQEAMDSLYVHCYLAADTHVVDSIKNLSSSMHTWLKLMAPGRKYHSKVEFARWSYCWWDRWTHLDLTEIWWQPKCSTIGAMALAMPSTCCSALPSPCSRAACCRLACTWSAKCSVGKLWSRPSRTGSLTWWETSCKQRVQKQPLFNRTIVKIRHNETLIDG